MNLLINRLNNRLIGLFMNRNLFNLIKPINLKMLRYSILDLFKKERFLTTSKVKNVLKKDKSLISGYLQAMADYGDLELHKEGNLDLYFLKNKGDKQLKK